MKKLLMFSIAAAISFAASAQKDTTQVIDNKGTIKWVISHTAAVITKADSTIMYVTPKQIADSSFAKAAANGLTKNGQTIELGGNLSKSTTIGTDAINILKITGLESGNLATDSLVVSASDGSLRRVTAESLLQSGDQSFSATAGQAAYTVAGMPSSVSKIWVYRNGVKLIPSTDYAVGVGQITLVSGIASLVAKDDFIEVQWVK